MNYPQLFGRMGFDLNNTRVEFYDIKTDSSGLVECVTMSKVQELIAGWWRKNGPLWTMPLGGGM